MNLQPYLNFAKQLAYRAGRITLSHYNKGIQHDLKSDDSPVTAADRATEEFIRGEIEKNYPSHAIVGEEYGERAGEENPFRWIVDPIDGTKSFMRQMDSVRGSMVGAPASQKYPNSRTRCSVIQVGRVSAPKTV